MAIHLPECYQTKNHLVDLYNPDTHLLIVANIPRYRVLRILARSVLLALFIVSLPLFNSSSFATFVLNTYREISGVEYDPINMEFLPLMFKDLTKEGLLKIGDKALFLSNTDDETAMYTSQTLINNAIDVVSASDIERHNSIAPGTFDFAFVNSFPAATAGFIDRTLKIDGVVAVQLSNNPYVAFQKPPNYKIVYLRRFRSTIMAMKKTEKGETNAAVAAAKRRLFEYLPEAKKAALKNLEDVLLEPPRSASRRSRSYLKRTKYLPDLMGDSLESYPRRVFIDVGLSEKDGGSGTGWFEKHYPTRNLKFEVYKIETVPEESDYYSLGEQVGMSEWLKKNVKEEEYVVMKAEAEAVEEMVKGMAISLVDELFLECKPQRKSRKAYWECLALYGKLRDEGLAVHQWWG